MLKNLFRKGIIFILEWEARLVLKKYKPSIIAVTGSVGKTSTKDAIYEVVASKYHTKKSKKSYNSELGVPLAILGLETGWNSPLLWIQNCWKGLLLLILKNHYPTWLVLEVGVDRPGDMARISHWLNPSVVVITKFADIPPHVEFFDSPEAVYAEKWHLALSLQKGGTLIINGDDERLIAYAQKDSHLKTISYGFSPTAELRATDLHIQYEEDHSPKGITFKAVDETTEVPVHLNETVGYGHVYSALAALLVGKTLDINMVELFRGK
jgi:UDP-N-acetylmuramoyl-tripeptide--D-alanyl-D-alanine ligase